MINAEDFLQPAMQRGYTFWTGVPCSFLKPFINYVIDNTELDYVAASSEGEAVGVALGAHLAGRKTVVICQNSGLGNTINPLTSLNHPFQIPTLLIVTHRGEPGLVDEPQHELMGQITQQLLETMGIKCRDFPQSVEDIPAVLAEVDHYIEKTQRPFALIMKKGTVAPHVLKTKVTARNASANRVEGEFTQALEQRMSRAQAIGVVRETLTDSLFIGTTGKIGRELFAYGHQANQFYVVGGMGCASSIGLGVSLNAPQQKTVVLDGDGAVLMKMGALATIGHYQPNNYIHVVLDNEAHESTGGQFTVSSSIDIAQVASACGYAKVLRCDEASALANCLQQAGSIEGPVMVHVKVKIESDPDLARPNLTPREYKEQFIQYVRNKKTLC